MTPPRSLSVLSIDVGHKRIGLAGCDPLGISITQLPPIIRGKFEEDLGKVRLQCERRRVEGLIIGLPLDENGLITKQAILCERYGKKLAHALHLPMALVNEHSTTWAAGERFNFSKDKSGKIDSASAALMLEQWLREGPELKPV